jgi:hypothetical protein
MDAGQSNNAQETNAFVTTLGRGSIKDVFSA